MRAVLRDVAIKVCPKINASLVLIIEYVFILFLNVQLTTHQTLHLKLCTALISRALGLISNY
jgi:hypothetical protein